MPIRRMAAATSAPTTHQWLPASRSDRNRPWASSSRLRSANDAVTPCTEPLPTRRPAWVKSPPRMTGAAAEIAGTAAASARASSSAIPGLRRPLGALMVTMSVPSASNCLRASPVAISPVEIIAITEAMPMAMPSRPSVVRSRSRSRLCAASRRLFVNAASAPLSTPCRRPRAARRCGSASGAGTAS